MLGTELRLATCKAIILHAVLSSLSSRNCLRDTVIQDVSHWGYVLLEIYYWDRFIQSS